MLERPEGVLVVLRDPLEIAEEVALDAEFIPVLDLMDGTRTPAQIRQSLVFRGGVDVELDDLLAFVTDLSKAGLLEDNVFFKRAERVHHGFLRSQTRAMKGEGVLFDEGATAKIRSALGEVETDDEVCGLLVPHQPLDAAPDLLRAAVSRLPDPETLEAVVVLGTDFHPGNFPVALTAKAYETPLGLVEGAPDLIAAFERRIDWATREQVRHRVGLAVELGALLLRHAYGERVPPTVFVTCGAGLIGDQRESEIEAFLAAAEVVLPERCLFVGVGELGHAGAAYERPQMSPASMEQSVHDLLDPLTRGRLVRVEQRLSTAGEAGAPPSGGGVIRLLGRLLPVGYRSEICGYVAHPTAGGEGLAGLASVRFLR